MVSFIRHMSIIPNGFFSFLQKGQNRRNFDLQVNVHQTKKKFGAEKHRLKTSKMINKMTCGTLECQEFRGHNLLQLFFFGFLFCRLVVHKSSRAHVSSDDSAE